MTTRRAGLVPFGLSTLTMALVVLSAPSAHAALLFSEDFSGAVPSANYGLGTISGTQFRVTANAVDIAGHLNGSFFTCTNNPSGNCVDLVGSPGVGAIASVPTFTLIAGDTYTITFDYILQGFTPNASATSHFRVGLGSFSDDLTAIPTVQHASLNFTPSATQNGVTLSFATLTEPDTVHGAVIDHIALNETPVSAVPEPSTLLLFGTGLVGMGRAVWRGRRRT